MRIAVAAIAVGLFLASAQPAPAKEPSVEVEISQEQVYEGQSVLYRITVNNVENPPRPELSGMDDFEVTPRGEKSLDSTQVYIFNSQRTEVTHRGRQYNYLLTPRKTGPLRIPAPTVKVDGKVIKGRDVALRVLASAEQDVVAVQILVDRARVRPLQPFTVTVSIAVKEVPSHPETNPLAVQGDVVPTLTIPWVPDERLPKGVVPVVAGEQWLRSLLDLKGDGVSINEIRDDSSLLFRSPSLGFQPKPKKVVRPDKNGNRVGYWQYDFSRTLMAAKLGRYEFGPATLEGRFATRISDQQRLIGETVFAAGKKVAVTAEDAPEAGRPEFYLRAFGRFQAAVDLSPQRARTGDPLTLTLTISGQGTFQDAIAPDLSRIAEIAERFKIYEATQEIKGGACRFTYGLRPLREGKEPFPPLVLAYFDSKADRYETLRTNPIPIEVLKAEQLAGAQIVSGAAGAAANRKEIEGRREGIFANVTDPGAVRNEAVHALHWLLGLGGAAGLYAAAALAVVGVRRRTGDQAALRRRAAVGRARNRLRQGMAELRGARVREGANLVQDALVGLVADLANLAEAGLTPKDACQQLTALGVEEEIVSQVGRLLDACEAACYGASGRDLEGLGRQAEELFQRVVRSLKAKKRLR